MFAAAAVTTLPNMSCRVTLTPGRHFTCMRGLRWWHDIGARMTQQYLRSGSRGGIRFTWNALYAVPLDAVVTAAHTICNSEAVTSVGVHTYALYDLWLIL